MREQSGFSGSCTTVGWPRVSSAVGFSQAVRIAVRTAALVTVVAIFLLGATLTRLIFLPLTRVYFRDSRCRARAVRSFVHRLLRLFVRLLEMCGLLVVQYSSAKLDPSPGAVLVGNHPSLLDALLVLAHVPQTVCVAKRSLVRAPILGPIARAAGFIPNSDIELIMREGEAVLRAGARLLIFPEGTRTRPSSPIQPFNSAGVGVALRAGAPVVPVMIRCFPPCLYKGQPLVEALGRRFEFNVTLCDPWGPFEAAADVAAQRHVRAQKTRQLQHFFEEHLYG